MSDNAHPLAKKLAHKHPHGTLLLVGIGNGRNLLPFATRKDPLIVVDTDTTRLCRALANHKCDAGHIHFVHTTWPRLPVESKTIAGAVSTHVLQHGTSSEICSILHELHRALEPHGSLLLTLGSQRDARFQKGRKIEEDCWAPTEGEEVGVPHLYLSEAGVRELLAEHFEIHLLEEHNADQLVGSWAHQGTKGIRHWFVHSRRRKL